MSPPTNHKTRIVFLMSDTGGGHRSAVEAITEALNLEFPNQTTTEMVDIFRQYAPIPLRFAPEMYPTLSRMQTMWGLGYHASDGKRRTRILSSFLWPYVRPSLHRLISNHPCDLVVAVHWFSNVLLRALRRTKTPFATVVTDLVSTHAFWYDRRANMVIVPTEAAHQRALSLGLRESQIHVVGLPVAERFRASQEDQVVIRNRLGWPQDRPVILLVGGGEGMGPLEQTAAAIDESGLNAGLVIITGRNQALRSRLEHRSWQSPTFIYGFVNEMPAFMRAADIVITKAGPGTISEAFIVGLPIILYNRVPGQEEGNVAYVVEEGAGVWASEPHLVVNVLQRWIHDPLIRAQAAANSRRLARPDAAREIARLLFWQANLRSSYSALI